MPASCRTLLWAALALVVSSEPVTPVEKVIKLLEDLKTEVESEGQNEATAYDKFACFCKDTTKTKGGAIITANDNINTMSATIEDKTAQKTQKATELSERKAKQEKLAATLAAHNVQCQKDKEAYEANNADLEKAISSMDGAIKSLKDSKPSSFLALRGSIEKTLVMADALKLLPPQKQETLSSLLQKSTRVDPSDPEYKFHSHGIIDTLEELHKDFTDEKTEADDEWQKTEKACTDKKAAYEGDMSTNKDAMGTLEGDIETLTTDTAKERSNLVNEEAQLKDDQQYIKDLTRRCEARAQDWDQRSELRANELEALKGALDVLNNKVKDADANVNKRALLAQHSVKVTPSRRVATASTISEHGKAPSFLQGETATQGALSMQERQNKALAVLQEAGLSLHSTALSALALRTVADPFAKVKDLIQKLVERLLAEAKAEVTKKGFCDTELGKARHDRDYRLADTKKLSAELGKLEAQQDALEAEIKELKDNIISLKDDLSKATIDRNTSKTNNLATIKEARGGLAAVTEALTILQVFYKQAAKAKVFLQASPVDDDTDGAGFNGAYRGKQTQSTGIIGMLEVIKTDFDRTVRVTTDDEARDHADFVEFDRVSRTDISGKETKKKLDEEDLQSTKQNIKTSMDDLQANQNLLDAALKAIEDLKPTCIDTGMSYEDRVAKRELEIQKLKEALCILDPEGTEADCSGSA